MRPRATPTSSPPNGGATVFELWLNNHADYGKKITELAIKAAQNRLKSTQKVEKRSPPASPPCPASHPLRTDDINRNELFLVEGDCRRLGQQGRDKETQAILPLRGKVLNTWEVDRDQLFKNNEVHDISAAAGVDPHGIEQLDSISTSPACATGGSSSCPMPMLTARTFRRAAIHPSQALPGADRKRPHPRRPAAALPRRCRSPWPDAQDLLPRRSQKQQILHKLAEKKVSKRTKSAFPALKVLVK